MGWVIEFTASFSKIWLMPPEWTTDYVETLKTEEKTWEDLDEEESYVKVGDPVVQVDHPGGSRARGSTIEASVQLTPQIWLHPHWLPWSAIVGRISRVLSRINSPPCLGNYILLCPLNTGRSAAGSIRFSRLCRKDPLLFEWPLEKTCEVDNTFGNFVDSIRPRIRSYPYCLSYEAASMVHGKPPWQFTPQRFKRADPLVQIRLAVRCR